MSEIVSGRANENELMRETKVIERNIVSARMKEGERRECRSCERDRE